MAVGVSTNTVTASYRLQVGLPVRVSTHTKLCRTHALQHFAWHLDQMTMIKYLLLILHLIKVTHTDAFCKPAIFAFTVQLRNNRKKSKRHAALSNESTRFTGSQLSEWRCLWLWLITTTMLVSSRLLIRNYECLVFWGLEVGRIAAAIRRKALAAIMATEALLWIQWERYVYLTWALSGTRSNHACYDKWYPIKPV